MPLGNSLSDFCPSSGHVRTVRHSLTNSTCFCSAFTLTIQKALVLFLKMTQQKNKMYWVWLKAKRKWDSTFKNGYCSKGVYIHWPQNQTYCKCTFSEIHMKTEYIFFYWCIFCQSRTTFDWDITIWIYVIWGFKKNTFKTVKLKCLAMHVTN